MPGNMMIHVDVGLIPPFSLWVTHQGQELFSTSYWSMTLWHDIYLADFKQLHKNVQMDSISVYAYIYRLLGRKRNRRPIMWVPRHDKWCTIWYLLFLCGLSIQDQEISQLKLVIWSMTCDMIHILLLLGDLSLGILMDTISVLYMESHVNQSAPNLSPKPEKE